MSRRNWMPLYIPDFMIDTAHLSAAETGAYLCLIMHYWVNGGLPDNDAKLAKMARIPRRSWSRMKAAIQPFFYDGWNHKRIDHELAKMIDISRRRQESASKAGTISAFKRANKTSTSRARDVNVALPEIQRHVHHTTQVSKITTTSSVAAREGTQRNPPDNSGGPLPPNFAERAREALQREPGIGSGELVATLVAKGWVES